MGEEKNPELNICWLCRDSNLYQNRGSDPSLKYHKSKPQPGGCHSTPSVKLIQFN